ncbi:MAG: hypothetical protein ACK5UE_09920 [Chitinophagales bacterium]|jgi:hypothetical protein|nr:hypothetical protein [Sphingobacteriales bacterium]
MWFRILALILVVYLFIGCRKAATEIPFYLKCDSALIASSTLGIANTGIYGLYITVENDIRGTWQMPFTMPILKDGLKQMFITPVVKINNLSTRFLAYPLYNVKQAEINMVSGKTLDTVFTFEYASGVKLIANDEMESVTNFSATTKSSLAKNGSGSMMMYADFTSVDSSATAFYYKQLPFNFEKTTFLEFDYYMPEGILAPALAYTDASGNPRIMFGESYLNENNGWVHVYYNYTYLIDRIGKTGLYTPIFILTMPKGRTSARAYLDNVRILEK